MILADHLELIASVTFALGCGLLTAILLRRAYRQIGKSRSQRGDGPIDAQPRPTSEWSGAYPDAAARLERQKVEMHDLGRELKAQLDNKISVLQALVAKSEEQIQRLESLLDESSRR